MGGIFRMLPQERFVEFQGQFGGQALQLTLLGLGFRVQCVGMAYVFILLQEYSRFKAKPEPFPSFDPT